VISGYKRQHDQTITNSPIVFHIMHVILAIVRCESGHVNRALTLGDDGGTTAGRLLRCILIATPARPSFNDNGREMLFSRGAKDLTMIPNV
jgi:hypothetical protein